MVGEERERASFEDVAEVAHGFEGAQELAIIWGPRALMRFQLRAVERERFPAFGASLLQHPADGGVGGVGRECEGRALARMK